MKIQRVKTNTVAARVENGELGVTEAQQTLNIRTLEASVNQQEETVRDQRNLVDLRSYWGLVILGILVATIASDFLLVEKVGTGQWMFQDNAYFLDTVITEHLIQIFGLVLIVLKSLFPSSAKPQL